MADADGSDGRQGQSVVLAPGEGREVPLGEAGTVTLKAVGEETGGRLTAYEFAMPPATAGPPLHLHRSWDEAFYVLAGTVTFLIDGRTSAVAAGGFVFVPRGVLHTFWNEGDAPARQLTVFAPAGIEHYFAEATAALAAGGEESLAAAVALMEKHDMVVPAGSRPAYGSLTPPNPPSE